MVDPKIRCSIPGYKDSKLKPCVDGRITVEPDNSRILLEDQVDVFLFTSCAAILSFLNGAGSKFVKYPGSLFRIVSNRRLFVGEEGLCKLIDDHPLWQYVFPRIMVFHGADNTGLQALKSRSNITCTSKTDDCMSFVAFGAIISAATGSEGALAQ